VFGRQRRHAENPGALWAARVRRLMLKLIVGPSNIEDPPDLRTVCEGLYDVAVHVQDGLPRTKISLVLDSSPNYDSITAMADIYPPWRKTATFAFSACLCFVIHLAKELYLRPLFPAELKLAPRLVCEASASAAVTIVWMACYLRLADEKGLDGIPNIAINSGGLRSAGVFAL